MPEDFRPILAVARAAEAVRALPREGRVALPRARRSALPRFDDLLESARRLFAADGSVRDDASPRLTELRARLRRRRNEVAQRMTKLLEERRDVLGDALLVQRNDRYCLPVLASARGRVPGIVHDRSGSGQTVFVEPMEVIEANNDLALSRRRRAARSRAAAGRVRAGGPRAGSGARERRRGARRARRARGAGRVRRADARAGSRRSPTTAPGRSPRRGIRCSTRASRACDGASSRRIARRRARSCRSTSSSPPSGGCSSSRGRMPAARPSS